MRLTGISSRGGAFLFGLALLVCAASPAAAQTSLGGTLDFLLTNQAVQTDDFVRDAAAAEVTRRTITRQLLVDLSTLPITSSSAAFTYRFDRTLGTPSRSSESFGPFFTERVATAGRGQISFAANAQAASFLTLDGQDLRDGRLLTTANQFRDEAQPFDVETLRLDITSQTVTFIAVAGVTDRLDLGVAAPFVRLSLEGERVNTYRGTRQPAASGTASASGLADIAFRAKYRLLGTENSGLAAAGEARVPTGREEDLLGGGRTSFRGVVIGSAESHRLGVHANVAFTAHAIANEVQYRGALTFSPASRVTVVGELVGRRVSGTGSIRAVRAPHPSFLDVDTIRLVADDEGTHTASIVTGFKWNIASTWLVNANASAPLTDSGLRSGTVVFVGLEFAVGR